MKSNMNDLYKWSGVMSIFLLVVLYCLKGADNFSDYLGLFFDAAGYSALLMVIYEKFLWRYNAFVKIPKFSKEYNGVLKYNYNGNVGEKSIDIIISQTLTSTIVTFKTDEISSASLTSELLEENNNHVLYYTYVTQPKSEFLDRNPIQYGGCKILIDNVNEFNGMYWTTSNTKGDIYFKKKND